LLNTLHSKNILEPLQKIQQEKLYSSKKVPLPSNHSNRVCDIYLNYGGSKIGSKVLASYGWRYANYIEAKFLKNYKSTKTGQDTNSQKISAELIADIIRLVILVPEPEIISNPANANTSSARYFLVLANADPSIFIMKGLSDVVKFFEKPVSIGKLSIDLGEKKAKNLAEKVGAGFSCLKLDLARITVFSHYPINTNLSGVCWMLLMRIDAAKISMTQNGSVHWFEIQEDRALKEAALGDYKSIRDFVATNIK
jgi:hypothetical protein